MHKASTKESSGIAVIRQHMERDGDSACGLPPSIGQKSDFNIDSQKAPHSVTLVLSPPNAPIYFCTQRSASCSEMKSLILTKNDRMVGWTYIHSRSRRPKLPRPAFLTSIPGRKPQAKGSNRYQTRLIEWTDKVTGDSFDRLRTQLIAKKWKESHR